MLYTSTVDNNTLSLLLRLMEWPVLKKFALVGGTNLSLQLGHRMSVDLDLFSNEEFLSEDIILTIDKIFPSFELIYRTEKSCMGIIEGIKVDMILHKYDYLQPIKEIEGIRLVSISDIIPMKLSAMAQRSAKKDFWDIAELLNHFTIAEMLELFGKKYKNHDYGYIVHSLYYFEDADNQEDPVDLKGVVWEQVKEKIKRAANEFVNRKL
ncbi:MAG TPA: hypothetical protein DCM71_04195 [Runella sp.]|nr:hypothetical protein [Runella sp.]